MLTHHTNEEVAFMAFVSRSLIHLDTPIESDFEILVLNSDASFAKQITQQLYAVMPEAKILYAPSIAIAQWLLKKRNFGLVISQTLLPDGSVSRLRKTLEEIAHAPDVIVVGEEEFRGRGDFLKSYSLKRTGILLEESILAHPEKSTSIQKLGADIRNDLNNPLQEIVAMAFVARAEGTLSPLTDEALSAIEAAAHTMSSVVNSLEGKITSAVK